MSSFKNRLNSFVFSNATYFIFEENGLIPIIIIIIQNRKSIGIFLCQTHIVNCERNFEHIDKKEQKRLQL